MVAETDGAESRQRSRDDEALWSDWMARALEGDREAYGQLMKELGSAIEAYVRSRFGSGGSSDFPEECVQESLLAVHRARHTYDPRRPFRPWLFTIVRHKAIDLLRRQRVRGAGDSLDAEDGRLPPPAAAADPSHRIDGVTLLGGLEPKYREALVLTKLEGCSIEEAAERAGVSASAMKTRVHRAIRAVRKSLRAEEFA